MVKNGQAISYLLFLQALNGSPQDLVYLDHKYSFSSITYQADTGFYMVSVSKVKRELFEQQASQIWTYQSLDRKDLVAHLLYANLFEGYYLLQVEKDCVWLSDN